VIGSLEGLPGIGKLWVEAHQGEGYLSVLQRLHTFLKPARYLEIGCATGESLAVASCSSLVIDPNPRLRAGALDGKPMCAIFRSTSDAFFATYDPTIVLKGPVDFAFLDGMHLSEFLLRDFINTERHCRRQSVIALHDCLPIEWPMAERRNTHPPLRAEYRGAWTGNVWRTALLLKRRRPDLQISAYAAPPTGLICISNLSPDNTAFAETYPDCVREMMGMSLQEIGIGVLFEKLQVEPTSAIDEFQKLSAVFFSNA